MMPPERVSEPVSLSGGPMAAISIGSRAATSSTWHGARRHRPTTTPGTTRTAVDGDRLRAGVAQLVEEVLDRGAVDIGRG